MALNFATIGFVIGEIVVVIGACRSAATVITPSNASSKSTKAVQAPPILTVPTVATAKALLGGIGPV